MLNMFKFDCPEVVTVEDNSTSDRIACLGRCHSGPVNDSPKVRAKQPVMTPILLRHSS